LQGLAKDSAGAYQIAAQKNRKPSFEPMFANAQQEDAAALFEKFLHAKAPKKHDRFGNAVQVVGVDVSGGIQVAQETRQALAMRKGCPERQFARQGPDAKGTGEAGLDEALKSLLGDEDDFAFRVSIAQRFDEGRAQHDITERRVAKDDRKRLLARGGAHHIFIGARSPSRPRPCASRRCVARVSAT
jgi:hypothetical protein